MAVRRLSLESLDTRCLMAVDMFVPVDPTNPHLPGETSITDGTITDGTSNDGSENALIGLLRPADGSESALIGLLVPAVQELRDTALATGGHALYQDIFIPANADDSGITLEELLISAAKADDGEGMLLPAVQKVREAAQRMGIELENVIISSAKGGEQVYLRYELKDVLITSYQLGGHAAATERGGEIEIESFSWGATNSSSAGFDSYFDVAASEESEIYLAVKMENTLITSY